MSMFASADVHLNPRIHCQIGNLKPMLRLFLIATLTCLASAASVSPWLLRQARHNPHTLRVVVHFSQQTDLTREASLPGTTKGHRVVSALKHTAQQTQAPFLHWAQSQPDITDISPFWISNSIALSIPPNRLQDLAARPELSAVYSGLPFPALDDDTNPSIFDIRNTKSVEWNVAYVNADQVWKMNITGAGTRYGNADTGIRWTHEALKPSYAGAENKHDYTWWDGVKKAAIPGEGPCGIDSRTPCDDNGHGSHTVSTTVGADGLGVAPGAKWLGSRNMDRGYGTLEYYLSTMQFFLAPTDLNGNNADPAKRPHVVGNSWGCPRSEGCEPGSFTDALRATRAAGIVMSVSNGNSGSSCQSTHDPPALSSLVFSVGASGRNSDSIAGFSSRGPAQDPLSGNMIVKPDITAPGSSVRGAGRSSDNHYFSASGTSMASPHIGGAVLLITEACPYLEYEVDKIEELLIQTARPLYSNQGCGNDTPSTIPNNMYGYGMLDVLEAVKLCSKEKMRF
jgi:serine protease AprX